MDNPNEDPQVSLPFTVAPWALTSTRRPSRARILRALVEHLRPMYDCYPQLLLPSAPAPTRLVALMAVWDRWDDTRAPCPGCGAFGLMTGIRGNYQGGRMTGICVGCAHVLSRPIGGFVVADLGVRMALHGSGFTLPMQFDSGWRLEGDASALVAALQEVGAEGLPHVRRARL